MTVRVLLFAYLRERYGVSELEIDVADGGSVADALDVLCERFETLAGERLRIAVNRVYVDNPYLLHENDELALIPPVSGGAGLVPMYQISDDAIDTAALLSAVADPSAGGTVLFVGTTRDHNDGRVVLRLEYEAYREMAITEMTQIGHEIETRWPVTRVAMVHRLGVVPIGEASVAVAVSAAHRDAAFAACRFGIDRLKATVPIWKKEHYQGGEVWIGACGGHHMTAEREGCG
jgi:molybdopterin converting factor subunit 1